MLYVFSNDVIFWTRHKPISKRKVTNNSLNNCVFPTKNFDCKRNEKHFREPKSTKTKQTITP